jgi:hypothetical protein
LLVYPIVTYDNDTRDFIDKVSDGCVKSQAVKLADYSPPEPVPTLTVDEQFLQTMGEKTASEKFAEKRMTVMETLELLNNEFDGWDDWEPETIRKELQDSMGFAPDAKLMNIVGALQTTLNTNYPFELWHIFENVSHAFNENPVSFSIVQPAELDEIALTINILMSIRPKEEFLDDVHGYIAASAKNSGVVLLPPDMFTAKSQVFLDDMNNDLELKATIERIWPNYRTGEGRLAIQTQRLKEVQDYVRDHG